ncbi:hypothetical protein V8C86DRAFT_2482754 [Haematococcus lacustris]
MAIRLCDPLEAAVLYSNRAAAYAGMSHFVKSLEDADQAVRLQPQVAKGHNRRGTALLGMRRWQQASVAFRKALMLEPGSTVALEGLQAAAAGAREFPE